MFDLFWAYVVLCVKCFCFELARYKAICNSSNTYDDLKSCSLIVILIIILYY
jgi:hypothetical protein